MEPVECEIISIVDCDPWLGITVVKHLLVNVKVIEFFSLPHVYF